jgi:predicted metal-dependent phosphoesterase TrpH
LLNVDLHCHSTASDGLLTPAEVIRLASIRGVSLVSLTDHDETAGLAEAASAAAELGLDFISGVEVSATWKARTIHVVGLGFDSTNRVMADGLARVRAGRARRARRIADELTRIGIEGSLEGASAYAGNPQLLSRTHFARFLVERNYARDVKSVFHHYLSGGKPGYVAHEWPSLEDAVQWIRGSGGIAVIAHPGRYRLSETEMEALFSEFRALGGQAVEVVTGNHTPQQCRRFSRLARKFGLAASRGSDFHGPGESRVQPGALAPMPNDLMPVWQLL